MAAASGPGASAGLSARPGSVEGGAWQVETSSVNDYDPCVVWCLVIGENDAGNTVARVIREIVPCRVFARSHMSPLALLRHCILVVDVSSNVVNMQKRETKRGGRVEQKGVEPSTLLKMAMDFLSPRIPAGFQARYSWRERGWMVAMNDTVAWQWSTAHIT